MYIFILKVLFLFMVLLHKGKATPTGVNLRDKDSTVHTVAFGETTTLECESIDEDHIFNFWHLPEKNIIVGPSNSFDHGKFKYEILYGNLTIKAVSKAEEGQYDCVSRGVSSNDINVRSVRVVVEEDWEEVYEHNPNVHLFRIVIVLATLMLLSVIGYVGYRIWKNRYRQPSYLIPSEDDDDEDSGDELFRVPGIPRDSENLIKTNSTESFETPGISTDFKSILDTANNK